MMTRRFMIVVAIAASVPTAARSQSAAESEPLAVVQRVFDGMREADSTVVRSGFAEGARFAMIDARTTPATIVYQPVDGWIRAIAGSERRWDEQIYDVQVRVDGNIAHAWTPYTFYLDKKVRHCGVNSIELLKDATGWKITQLSDTQRREGCPDPQRETTGARIP